MGAGNLASTEEEEQSKNTVTPSDKINRRRRRRTVVIDVEQKPFTRPHELNPRLTVVGPHKFVSPPTTGSEEAEREDEDSENFMKRKEIQF